MTRFTDHIMKWTAKGRNRSQVIALTLAVFLGCGIAAWAQGPLKKGVNPIIRTRKVEKKKRHNPLPKSSERAETTDPAKPAETVPVPGVEDKNAGIESYNKEEYDIAIERLNAAAIPRPADADIFYYLGDSYSAKKQYKEAIVAYEKAMQIAPQQATEEHYFSLGYAYEITQDNSNASANYKKAIDKNPNNPDALTHLGDVYSKSKDSKNAIDAYERAYRLNPNIDDPDVFFNWGVAYVNSSQQYDQAAKKFERAIELKVDNIAEAYFQLGRAYKFSGRFREAIDAYQKQLEKKADDDNAYWAYFELGDIYSFELPNKAAALDAYERAVRINSKDDWTWNQLGTLQNNLSKDKEAADSFSQAVQLKPDNDEYRLRLGRTYWRVQRYSDAIETLNKALELNPKLSEAYYYRGLSYRDLGRFDQAVESFNKGLEIGFGGKRSFEGNARYGLAVSYSKLGNVAATRQQCDLLRSMGPDAPSDSFGVCR